MGNVEPNFSKSRRHALKLNITCSMFRVRVVTKSSPFLVLSLHLSPRANVDHILPTLMGRIPLRSTPRRLPQAHRFLLSLGLLIPFPFTSPSPRLHLTPSPSHPVSFSLTLALLPISLTLAPSPLSLSPSPLSPHLSPSPSLTLALSHPRPRLSPLSRSCSASRPKSESRSPSLSCRQPPRLVCEEGLCFSRAPPPPVTLRSLHHLLASRSRPRLCNCAGKLGKYYSTSYF